MLASTKYATQFPRVLVTIDDDRLELSDELQGFLSSELNQKINALPLKVEIEAPPTNGKKPSIKGPHVPPLQVANPELTKAAIDFRDTLFSKFGTLSHIKP
jgi:hypothetical protein